MNFVGTPGSVSTYSYASVVDDAETDLGEWDMDVFEDLEREGRFKDKIVLVGTTIPEHQDLHATPFRDAEAGTGAILTPEVEIHAHAISTILSGAFIRPLPRPLQYLWIFFLGGIVVALAPNVRGAWGAGLTGALAATALATAWFLFSREAIWLWSATPILSLGLSYAGSTATLYLAEEQEKARIRWMFQQYVASSVVDELIKHPELLALGGEEREISVLFTDVADFSAISERMTPTDLVELLNEYLTAMTDIVLEYGGIVQKLRDQVVHVGVRTLRERIHAMEYERRQQPKPEGHRHKDPYGRSPPGRGVPEYHLVELDKIVHGPFQSAAPAREPAAGTL